MSAIGEMMLYHQDEMRAQGFIIDTHCYPPLAYKGDRFPLNPQPSDERHQCYSELESKLLDQIKTLQAGELNCQVFDSDGKRVYSGLFHERVDVPTHGSISLEVAPGRWVNIFTSEWITFNRSENPLHWKDHYNA